MVEMYGIDNVLREKGITRQELADYLHITPSGLGRYIRGEREAPYDVLRKMCGYLDLTTDYVLGMALQGPESAPADETVLLERYRRLSDDGKEILRAEALRMIKDYPAEAVGEKVG